MKRIIFRIKVLGLCCIVVIISMVLLAYMCYSDYSGHGGAGFYCPLATVVIAVDLVSAIFLSRMIYNQFKTLCRARLIKENHLFYVPAAISNDENSIDIYFSPFGLLLADRVIAFDAGKNRLFGVDISGDAAIIKYGGKNSEKTLKISGFEMCKINLIDLTNRLKYESDVTLNLLK